MDIAMVCALGSGLAFAGVQIALKRILDVKRGRGAAVVPWLFPALVGLLFPLWVALAVGGWQSGLLVWDLSWQALRWPLLWAVVMLVSGTGFGWLIQRFSLSEVLGYKKGLITLGAAVVDVFVFRDIFPWMTVLAIGLLLGGASVLTGSRGRGKAVAPRTLWLQGAVLVVWCAVVVGQLSLYKRGLVVQADVLSFAVLAQGLAAGLFMLLWLRRDVRAVVLPKVWVAVLLGCVLAGNLMEGFAYKSLPMAVVLVVTMLPATLLGAHDLWRGDVRATPLTALGFVCLAGGFVVLLLA